MRSIDDRLDSYAEAWKPEVGDKLIGVIVDLDERDSAYSDEPYPIVTVNTDDGQEIAFHAFHTVARNELAKQKPSIGDRLGVAYFGKRDGKSYEGYRVIVERAEPQTKQIDWSKHRTDDADDSDLPPVAVYDPQEAPEAEDEHGDKTEDDLPF